METFNIMVMKVRRPDENMVLMAIVDGFNKRMKFSCDLTKEEPKALKEFYYKADQLVFTIGRDRC